MAAHPLIHPSADALRAFALGKLNDTTAATLLSHLDSCPDCCKFVAALSGDDFLNRLRQARGQGSTPAPAKALSESAISPKSSPGRPAIANLPPELANNQQYQILRELGRGGMGVVYLAKNKLMERLEVLKVVNKTLLDHPAAVERFLREIRSAAKLSHANVVTAYSALQMGELLAFAMEYIEGQDLASVVKSQGPLSIPHACFYAQQAAHGLQHAFEKQMVHRDIKPQNLILAREGKKHIVKVLDFGLAKVMREKTDDSSLTGEGKMLGTPDYIAPEQTMDAAHADIRADIYSLGCTLYYLLSGHPPFSASSLGAILVAHQMHEAKPLNLVRPEVPEELASVVRRMMAKTPAKRYQTPLEVVQALAPFVKQGTAAKASPELSSSVAKPAVNKVVRVERSPVSAAETPKRQPESVNVWESLTEESSAPVAAHKSGALRQPRAATVRQRTTPKKWLISGGIVVGVLLLALLGTWAGGVLKVKTPEGTIVLENLPADAEVLVDDAKITVKQPGDGEPLEIQVVPGKRKLEIKKAGFKVQTEEVTLTIGERKPIHVSLKPQAKDENGFVRLFNGKNLTGWTVDSGDANAWQVKDGELVANGTEDDNFLTQGYLLSARDYSDFILRFQFKQVGRKDTVSGVALRAAPGETESDTIPNTSTFPFHLTVWLGEHPIPEVATTGFLWWSPNSAVQPPLRPDLLAEMKKVGEWNSVEIEMRGQALRIAVNGRDVQNVKLNKTPPPKNPPPGLKRYSGRIGFLKRTGVVRFRNIEIKELSAKTSVLPSTSTARRRRASVVRGIWKIDKGELVQTTREKGTLLLFGDSDLANYDFSFRAKAEEGNHGFKAFFHYSESGDRYEFSLGNYQNRGHDLSFGYGGKWGRKDGMYLAGSIDFNRWYDVRLEIRGQDFRCFLDGKQLFSCRDERFTKGRIGFSTWNSVTRFRDIRVAAPDGKVLWEGLPDLPN